tara:strand:- start:83 stop:703 length:621 start_codon:yes stop_codon:yes gene_type:complete
MKCKLGLAIAVAIVVGSVGAETLVLNDIQVYDTKSGKLYPTKTTFRDNDLVVAGTNPDFGFINVISYENVIAVDAESCTGGPVSAESLKGIASGAVPVGDAHTWVFLKYTDKKGAEMSVQLYAGQKEDMTLLAGIAAKSGKNVARYGTGGGGMIRPGMSAYDLVTNVGEPSGVVQYGTKLILGYGPETLGVTVKFVFEDDRLVDIQ